MVVRSSIVRVDHQSSRMRTYFVQTANRFLFPPVIERENSLFIISAMEHELRSYKQRRQLCNVGF